MRNIKIIEEDLRAIEDWGFEVEVAQNYSWVHVIGLTLPGDGEWTDAKSDPIKHTSVLVDIPTDFPRHPPGVGYAHPSAAIHIPIINYNGKRLRENYACKHSPWTWFCFRKIEWDGKTDNLVSLLRVIETSIWERTK